MVTYEEEYEDDEPLSKVIFDPSLVVPPAHLLLQDLLSEDSDIDILLTDRMKKVLFPENSESRDHLLNLLQLSGATKKEASLQVSWLSDYRTSPRFKITELKGSVSEFRDEHIIDIVSEITGNNDTAGFIADEICLALIYPDPAPILFCSDKPPSWVDKLKKAGAKLKKKIIEGGKSKRSLFRDKKFWKKVVATTASASFLWMFGGPIAGLGTLGAAGIHAIIEDP